MKREGNSPSLLLCIGQNMLFSVKNFSSKNSRKPSIYKALSHFCVIMTRASTRRTIPVAVPDICLRRRRSLASVDRGHSDSPRAALWAVARLHGACGRTSLRSLHLPLGSAPIAPQLLSYIFLLYRCWATDSHGRKRPRNDTQVR